MVGVGVLNGEGMIDDPNASAEIGGSRGDLRPLGEAALDRIALGAQHGIGVEDRRQHPRKGLGVGFRHNRIGCCRAALTHHHYRDLLAGQAALVGHPPARARRARQVALPLVGLQEVGFVRFHACRAGWTA